MGFGYDAEGARAAKQTDAETTYYAGDLYQQTTSASGTAQRFMVYAGGRAVAAVTQASSSAPLVVSYLHDDALGSVESITAADSTLIGGRHFDAFGDARGPIASVAQEPYGYTGQEQDPELGRVNMHGRMYDPRLGQFLSPDPEIQSPYGQGLNRFAYECFRRVPRALGRGVPARPSVAGRSKFPRSRWLLGRLERV